MLKKEICQRCHSDLSREWDNTAWSVGGRVYCPVSDNNLADFVRFVDSFPPKCCPYIMEQLVLGDGQELPPDEWLMDVLFEQEETP